VRGGTRGRTRVAVVAIIKDGVAPRRGVRVLARAPRIVAHLAALSDRPGRWWRLPLLTAVSARHVTGAVIAIRACCAMCGKVAGVVVCPRAGVLPLRRHAGARAAFHVIRAVSAIRAGYTRSAVNVAIAIVRKPAGGDLRVRVATSTAERDEKHQRGAAHHGCCTRAPCCSGGDCSGYSGRRLQFHTATSRAYSGGVATQTH
jgi:hypothetical protein